MHKSSLCHHVSIKPLCWKIPHSRLTIPLHSVLEYWEQPQNSLPAFLPRRARLSSIELPQRGHLGRLGISADDVASSLSLTTGLPTAAATVRWNCLNICPHSEPLINCSRFPCANCSASVVNFPLVMRMPCDAPSAAMTPKSSRTGFTPTLPSRQCL